MKSLVLLISLGLAVFFTYPLAAERARGECQALSRQLLPRIAHGATTPLAARDAAARALPGWPLPAGCAWLYWRFTLNPPA